MKIFILYDSLHGNTQQVSKNLASALSFAHQVSIKPLAQASFSDFQNIDLLIVGSPTHGGRPTPALAAFLSSLPAHSLNHLKAAAFDTRFNINSQPVLLKLLMKVIGYASPKISTLLARKGAQVVAPPQPFFVEGTQGPLASDSTEIPPVWLKLLVG